MDCNNIETLINKASSPTIKSRPLALGDLPQEILLTIFEHLSIQHRYSVAQVCSKWRRMIQLITKELFLTLDTYDYDPTFKDEYYCYDIYKTKDHRKKSIQLLDFFGKKLKRLEISWIPLALFLADEEDQFVKSDEFEDNPEWSPFTATPSSSYWFTNLLIKCPNLTCICISFSVTLKPNVFQLMLDKLGDQLEEFVCDIMCENVQILIPNMLQRLNPEKLRKLEFNTNLASVPKTVCERFPLLTHFGVKVWPESSMSDETMRPLKDLKHVRSLKLAPLYNDLQLLLTCNFRHFIHTLELEDKINWSKERLEPLKTLTSLRKFRARLQNYDQLVFIIHNLIWLEELGLYLVWYLEWDDEYFDPIVPLNLELMRKLRTLSLMSKYTTATRLHLEHTPTMESLQKFKYDYRGEDYRHTYTNELFQRLPIMFPNLVSFRYGCLTFSLDCLVECLNQLPFLRDFRLCIYRKENVNFTRKLRKCFKKLAIRLDLRWSGVVYTFYD